MGVFIRSDGLGLKAVPMERITIPLCEEAVRQNGLALRYVPAHFQNGMVCMMAVENNPMALAFVPKSRINHFAWPLYVETEWPWRMFHMR